MQRIFGRKVSFCVMLCCLLISFICVDHFYPVMRISGNIEKIIYNSVTEKAVEKYFTVSTNSKNTLLSSNGPDSHNTAKNISILSQKTVPRLTNQELRQIKGYGTSSPIVVKKYKLIFFWNQKAGCTYWKRLLQFIQGIKNKELHVPGRNGLTHLTQFKDSEVTEMMFDDSWIKAVFVREPRERVLSAFLEKGLNPARMRDMCRRPAVKSLSEFITLIKTCKEVHWSSQVKLPRHLYKYTWIGKMPDINTFTQNLLTKIGAWNDTVKDYLNSKEQFEKTRPHATSASEKLLQYYNDTESQDTIFKMYAADYDVFKFDKKYFK
ncbi:carbohydrate sulfotransferase 9-like [Mytilus trossulus]|uniref:carbohydrate sulfotransferase 9-like n=1 Tax=Mytilus trossulus TaxID=6551 RepID=UPI003007EE2F